ncbi:MAG: hypothetical protein ABII22_00485 [Candidatus Micrarchaeota archaeon]
MPKYKAKHKAKPDLSKSKRNTVWFSTPQAGFKKLTVVNLGQIIEEKYGLRHSNPQIIAISEEEMAEALHEHMTIEAFRSKISRLPTFATGLIIPTEFIMDK